MRRLESATRPDRDLPENAQGTSIDSPASIRRRTEERTMKTMDVGRNPTGFWARLGAAIAAVR
jgi:hypothetical protein